MERGGGDRCPTTYVVANGAEGESGTFKDRWLLRRNPYLVAPEQPARTRRIMSVFRLPPQQATGDEARGRARRSKA